MISWRSYNVYYSSIDRLILEVVHPFLEVHGGGLDSFFWERRYAGGPNLQVCFRGSEEELKAVERRFLSEISCFLDECPSPESKHYDMKRAAALMALEGLSPDVEDLTYRNNVVIERPYSCLQIYGSAEAAAVAEDFKHNAGSLAVLIMKSLRPREEELLRLFFALALYVGRGVYPQGCVSYKSHWEGFFATFPAVEVIERIKEAFQGKHEKIVLVMEDVKSQYELRSPSQDAVFARWDSLQHKYNRRVHEMFENGKTISRNPGTPDEVNVIRSNFYERQLRQSSFVRKLWSDERFLLLMQYDLAFQVPRALVNLLYVLLAMVGLSPLDKMALCYFAHRSVEEAYNCNLDDLLQQNIINIVESHGHRLA